MCISEDEFVPVRCWRAAGPAIKYGSCVCAGMRLYARSCVT